ncbi:MAG: phosphate ABC transporter permease PstA [Clostridia bacterium]|nr:phosphate ABC transporter permease PstA [Clostridia bacterium]MBQ9856824.1 phosphate ABC transporter permease PstA [Clostridia bacterium]
MMAMLQTKIYRAAVYAGMMFSASVLVLIAGYILFKGVPHLTPELFAWEYNSNNVSMLPSIINTLLMTLLSMIVCVPLGIGAAIYLTEYAPRGSKLVKLIRMTSETLLGIPSVIYGLFGSLFFVVALKMGLSLLSGALTLSIMVLPTIMRTTEEALISVPDSYREGSFGLGAGRLRTTFKVVLPSAVPGIMSGIILAIGRIAGETAALIYTAGTVAKVPDSLFDSGRTLAVHMYAISTEGLHMDESYATAVVLLIMVFIINSMSQFIARRIGGNKA